MNARGEPKSAPALERTDAEAASPELIANPSRNEQPEPVNLLTAPTLLADPAESNHVAEEAVRPLNGRVGYDRPIAPGRDVLP
jgi:hypothetical protein